MSAPCLDIARAAVALARRGVWVFPLAGKVPLTPSGYLDAVCDPDRARELFAASPRATGIGVDCGRSNVLVVDIDAPEAAGEWARLCSRHGGGICTLASYTARGLHLWFRTHEAPPRSRKLAPKLDTRGSGGYVVAPPSAHPSGVNYEWANNIPPMPAPNWLLEELAPLPPRPSAERQSLPPGLSATRYGRRALEGLADEMLATVEGGRHEKLVMLSVRAGRLAAAGEVDSALAEAVLIQAARQTGLPQSEALSTFEWGFAKGELRPLVKGSR